ncbi:MAG: helicase-exonuclease AddAB subunit AddB [Clostridia bacterium]|nr:helicase-exonuclease AddAB subunit AddB [Clostridia bacterium]
MSLQIVYGRAGSGKSEYCFDKILSDIENKDKIYIITPEQFSFTAEKKLLEKIENGAVINAEVLTFNRMAYRLMKEVYGAKKVHLTECGKSMLIYDIVLKNTKKLKFLGKTQENIEMIGKQITELKKHKVSVENLKETIEVINDDEYLKNKLMDIEVIYEEFENIINNRFIDENDMLTMLNQNLDRTDFFKDAIFYIDEFVGFTKQEYEVIKKLLIRAKRVVVTACLDDIRVQREPEIDVFYTCKQTVDRLKNLANQMNITVEEDICLKNNYRYKSSELRHLEKNMYEIPFEKYKKNVNDIKLFLAKNQYSEVENVAINISKLVKENGYRYNEIGVITKNIQNYSNLCKVIFRNYSIPLFIDEKKDLSQNILVKYILGILEIFSKNWSTESVFNYLKIGLTSLEQNEIYKLENYCTSWGINRAKWYNSEWNYGQNSNEYEILRKRIVAPLINLKKKIQDDKSVKNITKQVYDFLIENGIDNKINKKIEELREMDLLELASDYEMSWNIVMDVFDEIVLVFGDEQVGFDKYTKILKIGLANSELGNIPIFQDQVIVGDVDRTRSHKMRAIFIIGLNDGEFPNINKGEGFLNDLDRKKLMENKMELAKGTLERLYEDNFNIYKAFTIAEEKLYLSYSSATLDGKSLRPSILISKIKKIFENIIEESDIIKKRSEVIFENTTFIELLNNLRDFRDGKVIDKKWFNIYNYYKESGEWAYKLEYAMKGLNYSNVSERISKENIERLYGEDLKTSISKLEQYQSCPFSYYLKYGLKLQEPETYNIELIDTGSFMHDVLESFFNIMRGKDLEEFSSEEMQQLLHSIIDEKLELVKNYKFSSSPKFIVLTNKLKRVIDKSVKYIIEELKQSHFFIEDNEVKFGDNEKYGPIKLSLEDGKTVELVGKIDRIDSAHKDGKKYLRIIDYKSSSKSIDFNEIEAGLQIQLLTYINAVCEKNEDVIPAGVLYFNLIDPVLKLDRSVTDEQIEDEMKKHFKMQGLILSDIDIVKMMDKNLETGYSKVIPVCITKDGKIIENKSSTIKEEQYRKLQNEVTNIIKDISKRILHGDIPIEPYYKLKNKKTPCKYCKYKAICTFNPRECDNKYNYIKKLKKEEILENL